MSLFGDDLLSMDYSGWDIPTDYSFSTPSYDPVSFGDYASYEPNYISDYFSGFGGYDPTDWSYGFDSTSFDPVFGTYSPSEDYSFAGLDTNLGVGSPLLGTAEKLGLIAQDNQNKDEGILSSILDSAKGAWDKTGEFLGGKNNMSTLLTLATLASMGQKPKGPVNAGGPPPSSVAATEIYNNFTPQQQANMNAFASKRNLVPLAQQFDPRTYGYGGEVKFFDREV